MSDLSFSRTGLCQTYTNLCKMQNSGSLQVLPDAAQHNDS